MHKKHGSLQIVLLYFQKFWNLNKIPKSPRPANLTEVLLLFIFQPDRTHHCSVCNDCVLKMDHHCPWVNNCVGYYNQKFFFLFLGYAFLYCMYVMLSTLKYFIAYWSHENAINISNGKFHVIFLFFVSGMFAISLCSLFGYHIYLISQNRTTLEAFR